MNSQQESFKQLKANRCTVCARKVGIDYFTCRCDPLVKFCHRHRFPYEHNCWLDVKKEHQTKIMKGLK